MEKNKFNIILMILLVVVILLIALGGVLAYDRFTKNDVVGNYEIRDNNRNEKEQEIENEAYKDFLEKLKSERKELIILQSPDDFDDGYEIRLTNEGEVIADVIASTVGIEDIDNQVIETNVLGVFIVEIGQGDVGDNRELIFIKENGEVTSISLGRLLINCEIKVNDYKSLKWIVDVYDRVIIPASQYEPTGYSAYAKDINGEEIDITKLILENRN